jgi:hypothetical protein
LLICLVSKITQLLERLSACHLCVGNPDEVFLRLPNIHNGVFRDHSSKMSKLCIT